MTHQLWLSIYDSQSRNAFLIEIKKAIFSPKEALVIEKDPDMATGSTSGHFYKLEKIRRVGKNVTTWCQLSVLGQSRLSWRIAEIRIFKFLKKNEIFDKIIIFRFWSRFLKELKRQKMVIDL